MSKKSEGYVREVHPLVIRLRMLWKIITTKNVLLIWTSREKGTTTITPHVSTRTNFNGSEEAYIINHVAASLSQKYNSETK